MSGPSLSAGWRKLIGYCASVLACNLFVFEQMSIGLRSFNWTPFLGDLEGNLIFALPVILLFSLPIFVVSNWISERFDLRNVLYYPTAGIVAGVLAAISVNRALAAPGSPYEHVIFGRWGELGLVGGLIGGLTYWLIAGRYAGLWRDANAGNQR